MLLSFGLATIASIVDRKIQNKIHTCIDFEMLAELRETIHLCANVFALPLFNLCFQTRVVHQVSFQTRVVHQTNVLVVLKKDY